MRHDLERSWDAEGMHNRMLHPQEGEETEHLLKSPTNATRLRRSLADANAGELIERDDASTLEVGIAFVLAALVALLVMGLVAFATIWWLEASDCGDHATWSCGL